MIRFTFIMAWVMQIAAALFIGAFLFALVFHPEEIGATVARIIVGFMTALKGGAA